MTGGWQGSKVKLGDAWVEYPPGASFRVDVTGGNVRYFINGHLYHVPGSRWNWLRRWWVKRQLAKENRELKG